VFTAGAAVAAVATYGAFGAIGSALGRPSVLLLLAVAVLFWACQWYLRGRYHLPGGRQAVQANRNLAVRGPAGMLYFGALLGVGLLTEMSTPLVYAGAALSLSQGIGWGALYGVGFGLGRSVPALAAALIPRRDISPAAIARTMAFTNRERSRWLGLATSAGVLAFAVTAAAGRLGS
jgi:hypothetical protein